MKEYIGNLIYIDDLRLGGVYVQEDALIPEAEALLVNGELKPGYTKLESINVLMYVRNGFYRDRFNVVFEAEDGWYRRDPEAPHILTTGDTPELYGTLIAIHLSHKSYDFFAVDENNRVYFNR